MIEAANRAFPEWRKKTAKERAAVLRRWFELMIANTEDLAKLMTTEQGKPLVESRGEAAYAGAFLEWFGEEAKRVYGDTIPGHQPDKRIVVIKQPIGVAACITPWNFSGDDHPQGRSGHRRRMHRGAETGIANAAQPWPSRSSPNGQGFLKGVFNVVTGSAGEIGGELTANPIVRKLSFTGSTEVGKVLMAQCAQTVKKISLELGGNAPFIVFDDADLDAAVEGAIASITAIPVRHASASTGSTCRTACTTPSRRSWLTR